MLALPLHRWATSSASEASKVECSSSSTAASSTSVRPAGFFPFGFLAIVAFSHLLCGSRTIWLLSQVNLPPPLQKT